ncbi:MAG: hypothetical protein RMK30_00835 [Anaerolineae bacterium]|nr:hypothetical protein [Anaerolineae bacterium]MDW8101408.1 hypothetical protein [Anaerolineae bacterium]
MRKAIVFLALLLVVACAGSPSSGGISPEGHYFLGLKDAKVLIEEYSDFQ